MRLTVPSFALLAATSLACLPSFGSAHDFQQSSRSLEAHHRHRRAILSHEHNHSPRASEEYRQHVLNRRQAAGAPQGTTEGSAAKVENPQQECTPYGLPEINTMIKHDFPTIWQVADILPGDTQALQILKSINDSGIIPADIPVRGDGSARAMMGAGLQNGYNAGADTDCWWTASGCVTPKHKSVLPDISSCDEPHTWGYGFDDGPNCTHNAFYDFLQQNNQKATMFYIGSNLLDWPLEGQRGLADGHQICVHTWSHHYMTSLTTNQAFAELYYTMLAFRRVLGITVTCWRPPFGDVDDRIRAIAQGLGLRTYIWGTDTNDFDITPDGPSPTASIQANYDAAIAKGAAAPAETGGIIVLTHELTNGTMEMAVNNLPKIKSQWKNVVPLNACLNITHPYVEDIIYPNFAQYVAGQTLASGLPTGSISIDAKAAVTPQGTLSGMGGLMATAAAGGPDNNPPANTGVSGSSGSGSNATKQSQKSGVASLLNASSASFTAVVIAISSGFALFAARF